MRILFLVALFCLVCYCSVLRGARMAAASGVGADSLLGSMDDTLAWAERERQREQSRRLDMRLGSYMKPFRGSRSSAATGAES